MIQIATAESVLRLDKTLLKEEAKAIQQIYIAEQSHETLLEYIECELGRLDVKEDRRQLMQVSRVSTQEVCDYLSTCLCSCYYIFFS